MSYLFAADWAPRGSGDRTLAVPGAKVDGPETAGNLLNVAIWTLRGQGLIEVEQLRPAVRERAGGVMGGESFTELRPAGDAGDRPGLEGAVLRSARDRAGGTRGVVVGIDLDHNSPWNTVGSLCFAEAHAAGLLESKGRLFPRPVIADGPGVEALRERDAQIARDRRAYREREGELDDAVAADCVHALHWALNR